MKDHRAGYVSFETHEIKELASPKEIHPSLNLSQAEFATIMNVSIRTIQDWEQERRKPNRLAIALLQIVELKPEFFLNDKIYCSA